MRPLLFRLSLVGCLVGALFSPSLRAATTTSNLVQSFTLLADQVVSDPARDLIYASLYYAESIAVINPETLTVSKKIAVGGVPHGMAISADGTKLYVALDTTPQIAVVDLTTETVLPSLTIAGTPSYIAAGLGDRLYVTTSNGLLQINALTGATESNLGTGGYLQINQARTQLFVGAGNSDSTTFYRFDVSGATATLSQMSDFDSASEDFSDFKLSHNGSLLACVEVDQCDGISHTLIIDAQNLGVQYGSFDQADDFGPSSVVAVTFSPDDQIAYLVDDLQIVAFNPASFARVFSLPNTNGSPGKSDIKAVTTDKTGRYLVINNAYTIDVYDLQANLAVTATALLDQAFYYGVPIYLSPATITVTGLPSGLTFDEASHTISGTPTETGVFPIVIKASNGSTTVTVTLTLTVYSNSRALNISTRALVQPGDDALIAGFIIQGEYSKNIVVRALGPSLSPNGVPLPGRLMDPMLEVYDSTNTLIGSNNNWKAAGQTGSLTEFGLAPTNDFEAALYLGLEPGAYTVVVRGLNNTSGIALAEVYDVDTYFHPGNNDIPRLANISTRGLVEAGDNVMIGGVIIGGPAQATMLLRGLGPSLSAHGVPGVLADPQLTLYNSDGTQISSNNNWQDSQEQKIEVTGLAPTNPLESAIDITLAPGAYTAILKGVNNGTGSRAD